MTSSPWLAALLGTGTGAGVLLAASAVSRTGPVVRSAVLRRPRLVSPGPRALRLGSAIVAGLLTARVTGWAVGGVLAGLGCWMLPRVLGPDRGYARQLARIEAIASWTESLRDTLSAAAGLEQAIHATAPLAPAAIAPEITALASQLARGDRLAPALRRLATSLDDPTGDLVIAALVLAAEHESRQLAALLSSLAHAAREQASMRMRVAAGRAGVRTSVRVIAGTTLALIAALIVLNPKYLSPFDDAAGQLVLALIGGMFALGFWWMNKIANLPGPPRILAPATAGTPSNAHHPIVSPGVKRCSWPQSSVLAPPSAR